MKTMTIRDLRQRWPEAEEALQREGEILITRDGKPVAKLAPITPESGRRKRWNAEAHLRWLRKAWSNKPRPQSDLALARARADRWDKESE